MPALVGVILTDTGRDVEVERFVLDPADPRRAIHVPRIHGAWGMILAKDGMELSDRAIEAAPAIAAKYGVAFDPDCELYTMADGPAFLVALLALYGGATGGDALPIEAQ